MLNFDLQLQRGAFHLHMSAHLHAPVTGILGPSGAGKSTLLALLAGLLAPTQGRIVLADRVLVDTRQGIFVPPHQRHIGLLFQEGRLFPHLDVRQNLLYGWQRLRPSERRYALDDIVDLLDIAPLIARQPGQLSGGERQRVALGRALLYSPQLLLLDEPLSALDSSLKAHILQFLKHVRDETGIPMLYVSHAREEIDVLTRDVLTITDGRLLTADDTAVQG